VQPLGVTKVSSRGCASRLALARRTMACAVNWKDLAASVALEGARIVARQRAHHSVQAAGSRMID
jgi:hypothetical protein